MTTDHESKANAKFRSRTVLVQDDAVVGTFPTGQINHARKTAHNVAEATNKPVAIYALRDDLPEPPLVGTTVQPGLLGWMPLQNIPPG